MEQIESKENIHNLCATGFKDPTMMDTELSHWIEGPRWSGISTELKKIAHSLSLQIEFEIHKGWIYDSVFYKVRGPKYKIDKFVEIINRAIKRVNYF